MKKQVNIRIEDSAHQRLSVLAAYAQETQGEVVERLIEAAWQQRHASIPDLQSVQ